MYGFKNREHVETLKQIAIEHQQANATGTLPAATLASGSRIFIVRPTATIPACSDDIPGSGTVNILHHSWGENDVSEPTGALEIYSYENGTPVTRTAYNVAAQRVAAEGLYIAVEDSFGKLVIIQQGAAEAGAAYVVSATGDAFGMGTDPESGLPIFATDLNVASDTVNLYRSVAVEYRAQQVGGSEA